MGGAKKPAGRTARKTAPRRRSAKRCKHTGRAVAILGVDVEAYACRKCDAVGVRPVGRANDSTSAVQVEMRAAELEETEHWEPDNVITHERWGLEDHDGPPIDDDELYLTEPAYLAGYLSAEIESHDARDTRDADAWAWRVDRPLAEQLAETAADDAAADALADLRDDPLYAEVMEVNASGPEMPADRSPTATPAITAALAADLDAKGPAWNALNDAEDADLQAGGPAMTTAEEVALFVSAATGADGDGRRDALDAVACTACGRTADSAEIAHAKWWTESDSGWRCVGCNAPGADAPLAVAIDISGAANACDPALDAMEHELTRDAEPDCRDEDGPEVERIMEEMENEPGPAVKRYLDHAADAACRRVPTLDETLDRQAGVMRALAEMERKERDRLTAAEVTDYTALSDSDVCQACGDKWTAHGHTCSGSAAEVNGG